jgi:16S rRNA (adenine1518-N6/adenine1519-N6)-dimethyltransferase
MSAAPRLKKRYGQHHLRHSGLCRPLIDFLRPRGRRVLEIGSGGGVLSGELLRAGARVWAWEVDPEWGFRIDRRLAGDGLVTVVGDALEIEWGRLPAGTLVTGNLPYGIATRLLQDLLAAALGVGRAGFLVQAEVADRLSATAGDADYGALSVLVKGRAQVRLLGRVRRGSFRPPPKVDGAFVGFCRHAPVVPLAEWAAFESLVRLAFAQRRKTLRNALSARWGRGATDQVLAALSLSPAKRAVELDLDQFVALYREGRRRGLALA